jgi:hypothetical protein
MKIWARWLVKLLLSAMDQATKEQFGSPPGKLPELPQVDQEKGTPRSPPPVDEVKPKS